MKRGSPEQSFTLIELLVVVAIISILMALLLPGLGRARDRSKAAVCTSNQRQIGTTLALYCDDQNQYFPPTSTSISPDYYWQEFVTPYVVPNPLSWRIPDPLAWYGPSGRYQGNHSLRNINIFNCPAYLPVAHAPGNPNDLNTGTPQYALNALLNGDWVYRSPGTPSGGTGVAFRASDLLVPIVAVTETVMLESGNDPEYGAASASDGRFPRYHEYMRHMCGFSVPHTLTNAWWDSNRFTMPAMPGGANYLYTDGHVEFVPATTYWALYMDSQCTTDYHYCPWVTSPIP